ncbi:uncharacterized protein LOC135842427 [Planococcus citri]|uniref:uncharacterized protein LOC135842427 n=1 Tax=Planococcus citri TaxID=170843 RepID=UPI0031F9B8D0
MFELICKISFFLFMLVMYAYITSTSEVVIIILGYICCVFSYHYFQTIKTAVDNLLNYVQNYGLFKTNHSPAHVPNYVVSKKYNKVNNTVNVPTLNNKIFVPVCRNNNAFASSTPAVFNCKFNNFIMNGDLPSPIMPTGLFVENSNKSRDKMRSPMQNMDKICNNSTLRYRNDSKSAHNPFAAHKKYNSNLDMETYMNVKSPGFTSRIVDKAMESASYHIKYPAVKQISTYRFDKSTLRHLSKIPRMSSSPLVRIAPPEPINIHLLNGMEKKLDTNEALEPNFLQVLKDISRKRNFSQEEAEKSNGTAKKSRKNDIKNLTISQYKRSLEDKSRDALDDKIKKRCEDHKRDAAKMVVYAPSIATTPDRNNQSYSKKRKSSNKSKNEYSESNEKCRRIHKSSKEVCATENLDEQKPKECNLRSSDPPSANELKLVDDSDQRFKQSRDEPVEGDDIEYVRVASGKILNRTNRPYRRKLNSNKIDPVSVIASEPEIVGEINGTDDVTMKEHLLQNLLSNIERKGHKDEKVIFYENSILTDVAKNHAAYEEPPQQVPNPIFTDNVVPSEDEVEMCELVDDELEESPVNTCNSPSIASYTTAAMYHSTPIISNAVSTDTNHTTTSKVFGAGSFINLSNGQNSTDSGYDTFNSSREQISPFTNSTTLANSYDKLKFNSTNGNAIEPVSNSKAAIPASSAFSFNHSSSNLFSVPLQLSSASRNSCFAQSNGTDSKIQPFATSNVKSNPSVQFGSNSASLFGSGDGNFFSPGSRQMGDKSENVCDFGVSAKSYPNTFGCKDGTSMQCEPSFSSIATEYPKNSFEFKNGEIGSAASVTFNIGTGGNSRNHAARSPRNK